MTIARANNSILKVISSVGGGGEWNYLKETIGNKEYKAIKLKDGNIWLAQNLDYLWQGLEIGGTSYPITPHCWYYNNDEVNYKKGGLLYNWYAAKYLSNNKDVLCPGWDVPSRQDLVNLVNAYNVAKENFCPLAKAKAFSVDENYPPISWAGYNAIGLNILPSGYKHYGSFYSFSTITVKWLKDEYNSGEGRRCNFPANGGSFDYDLHAQKDEGYSIILIKRL